VSRKVIAPGHSKFGIQNAARKRLKNKRVYNAASMAESMRNRRAIKRARNATPGSGAKRFM